MTWHNSGRFPANASSAFAVPAILFLSAVISTAIPSPAPAAMAVTDAGAIAKLGQQINELRKQMQELVKIKQEAEAAARALGDAGSIILQAVVRLEGIPGVRAPGPEGRSFPVTRLSFCRFLFLLAFPWQAPSVLAADGAVAPERMESRPWWCPVTEAFGLVPQACRRGPPAALPEMPDEDESAWKFALPPPDPEPEPAPPSAPPPFPAVVIEKKTVTLIDGSPVTHADGPCCGWKTVYGDKACQNCPKPSKRVCKARDYLHSSEYRGTMTLVRDDGVEAGTEEGTGRYGSSSTYCVNTPGATYWEGATFAETKSLANKAPATVADRTRIDAWAVELGWK